jgi:hypothetical protein
LSSGSDIHLRCRRFGWWSLLLWLSLGLVLEAMHGFKIGWYLDVGNDARRLLLRLAHAHGVLVSLVVLAFAATSGGVAERTLVRVGTCLRWAAVLMPLGFLLGGLWPMGGDPGLGIVLVPAGGVLLFVGVFATARSIGGNAP